MFRHKLIIAILALELAHSCVSGLAAQYYLNKAVYQSGNNIPLGAALDSIGRELGVNFSYNSDLVPHKTNIHYSFKGETLSEVLSILLDTLAIGYLEKGRQIALYARRTPIGPSGRNTREQIEIRGRVLQDGTRKAIPYASVSVENYPIGTITNANGFFVLRIPLELAKSPIRIASIGYYDEQLLLAAIDTNTLIIKLREAQLSIPEAIVRPADPQKLIKAAIKAIPSNYDVRPSYLTAFFREVTWNNTSCISLSESVLKIYKGAYINPSDNDQVKLYKGRKRQDSIQLSRLNYKVEGGLFNSLMIDLAKNQASFLDPESMDSYQYGFGGFTSYNGKEVYIINFDQKEGIQDALFKGVLYLDVKSLAIAGAEFHLSPRGMRYARGMLVRKSPFRYQVKPLKAEYAVNYRPNGGRWELESTRMQLEVRARPRKALASTIYRTISEMVITAKDTTGIRRFRNNEVSRSTDILVNQISNEDPAFWEGFNILEPEVKLEEAVKKLQPMLNP